MTIGQSAMNGFGLTPDHGTPSVPPELREALRLVLRRHFTAPRPAIELRAELRPLVRRARDGGLHAEQLLVAIKGAWTALLEEQAAGSRVERTRQLERVVTLAIELYYEP